MATPLANEASYHLVVPEIFYSGSITGQGWALNKTFQADRVFRGNRGVAVECGVSYLPEYSVHGPMKNPLDENRGKEVLEELARQLKNRDNIGRMLGDLGGQTPDILAAQLVDELERIISGGIFSMSSLPERSLLLPRRVLRPEPVPPPEVTIPQPSIPVRKPVKEVPPEVEARVEQVKTQEPPLEATEQEERIYGESEQSARKQVPRIPSELGDESCIYLHGVSRIDPGDTPSAAPFLLEEKGIDSRNFAFAVDYQGLRFYGSILYRESVNLTKNGVLLLNKQEKVRMRGAHEGILNDLRFTGFCCRLSLERCSADG